MNERKKILILGMGNDILTDDGIGPRLIHDLTKTNSNPNITFDIACCGGLEVIEHIKGYDKVIILDAIQTRGGKPGDVYYFRLSDFRDTSHLSNLHDINFLTALKLGSILEIDLPADLHIIAIEIIEDMEFSEELTLPLRKAYPTIIDKVRSYVEKIIKE